MPVAVVRRLLAFLAAAILASAAHAQLDPPAPAETVREATMVVAVEVPVQVVAAGSAVKGLSVEDFELYDRGQRRAITGFEVLDLAPAAGAPAPAVQALRGGRRHLLLFFDLAFSQRPYLLRAHAAALRLVAEDLHPSDLLGIAIFSPARGARLLLGFTSDRRQAEAVLLGLGAALRADRRALRQQDAADRERSSRSRREDPLFLSVADLQAHAAQAGLGLAGSVGPAGELLGSGPGDGLGGQLLSEVLQDLEAVYQQDLASQRRSQVRDLTGSLADVADALQAVGGQKHLLFLSEGFDSGLLGTSGGSQTLRDLNRMIGIFRRGGWVIQSIDIGGLRAGPAQGEDALFVMAHETGGRLYRNTSDLRRAMGEVLETTSHTYVLTFQPGDLLPDGAYHRLEVRVRNAPRGARVLHRPGYFAPKPFSAKSDLERTLEAAELVLGHDEGGSVRAATLAVPLRAGERALVPVLLEVDGETLLAGHGGGELEVEAYVYALDAAGGVADLVAQRFAVDLAAQGARLRDGGLKLYGDLELLPGGYRLRTLVRNRATGAYALGTLALEVPAATGGAALLRVLFPEPAGSWVYFRETTPRPREADDDGRPFPFTAGGNRFMPMAAAVLPRREVPVVVFAYGLELEDLEMRHGIEIRDGRALEAQPLRLLGPPERGAAGLLKIAGTLDASGLAPGEYVLRVELASPDGARSAASATAFSVE